MTRTHELRLWLKWAFLLLTTCFQPTSAQPSIQPSCVDPRACVAALHRGLVELSREEGEGDIEHRYARLEPLINATHDLPYIARVAVRRHWMDFSAEEQDAFLEAFSRLSVMTYAARFVRLSEDTFRILEVSESAADRAQVVAAISRESHEDIPIEYLLHEDARGWRIVNVIADGVSDLALRRSEYQRILAEGSVGDLIAHLDQQIRDLM